MNGEREYTMDDHADNPGSVPAFNDIYFLWFFVLYFFYFVFFCFFLFLWGRVVKLFHLTTEPPITQYNKQLYRNGVHVNAFIIFVF